ncbi:MAG: YiiX/YebB-like N1pC/P60 family cysteine hydrolase [Pseudomonadota bacterium]
MLNRLVEKIGKVLADYLAQPLRKYEPFSVTPIEKLQATLRPGDILLVEGNQRLSVAIKYLTQSTWSHAALYIGEALGPPRNNEEPKTLIEADLKHGVTAVPISKYGELNTRICRPIGLSEADCRRVIESALANLGHAYDLKNVIDLLRYLWPTPPVPVRWRRRMLALGSGDPTRAICSTLIARAFQEVRYPILPIVCTDWVYSHRQGGYFARDILHIRHHSLFAPRDFDLSPYFQIVKPTIEHGFDYTSLVWEDDERILAIAKERAPVK